VPFADQARGAQLGQHGVLRRQVDAGGPRDETGLMLGQAAVCVELYRAQDGVAPWQVVGHAALGGQVARELAQG
jgi:hypothetical protein